MKYYLQDTPISLETCCLSAVITAKWLKYNSHKITIITCAYSNVFDSYVKRGSYIIFNSHWYFSRNLANLITWIVPFNKIKILCKITDKKCHARRVGIKLEATRLVGMNFYWTRIVKHNILNITLLSIYCGNRYCDWLDTFETD